MQQTYIFGYGSLINLNSISKTLRRPLVKNDLWVITIQGCKRTWSIKDDVYSEKLQKAVSAVFLNIEINNQLESVCNGVIFKVNTEELKYLICREKNYLPVDVTNKTIGFDINDKKIISFIGKPEFIIRTPNDNSFVMNNYLQILYDGCNFWGKEFRKAFLNSTQLNPFSILDGDYRFIDSKQNEAINTDKIP